VVRAGELTLRFGGVDHGALAAGTFTVLKREAESETKGLEMDACRHEIWDGLVKHSCKCGRMRSSG